MSDRQYVVHDGDGRTARFTVDTPALGQGRQGTVYAIAGDSAYCAKIYFEPKSLGDIEARLRALSDLAGPNWRSAGQQHWLIAAPLDICRTDDGKPCGYIMQRLTDPYVRLTTDGLLNTGGALRRAGIVTWRDFVSYAIDLAETVTQLHRAGYVVGDLSLDNLFAQRHIGRVTVIDADSFQFVGKEGTRFTSTMWRPENSPPEVHAAGPGKWRTHESDRFSLGVVVIQILMDGFHPFSGAPVGFDPDEDGDPDEASSIQRGLTWVSASPGLTPARAAPPASILPPEILGLVHRCFVAGADNPDARPSAKEWAVNLRRLRASLKSCSNPSHRYSPHLASCPWCERAIAIGRDPFPPRPAQSPPATVSVRPDWAEAAPTKDPVRSPVGPAVLVREAPKSKISRPIGKLSALVLVVAAIVLLLWQPWGSGSVHRITALKPRECLALAPDTRQTSRAPRLVRSHCGASSAAYVVLHRGYGDCEADAWDRDARVAGRDYCLRRIPKAGQCIPQGPTNKRGDTVYYPRDVVYCDTKRTHRYPSLLRIVWVTRHRRAGCNTAVSFQDTGPKKNQHVCLKLEEAN